MKTWRFEKESFAVIGKEGSTADGAGFIKALWAEANSHFEEVRPLAKKDENGDICEIWGAMSDFSRSFGPWKDFSEGLYLAGVACEAGAQAPAGWTKWNLPGYEYICLACENDNTFCQGMQYLKEHHLPLAGAVQEYSCARTGKTYLLFPIREL